MIGISQRIFQKFSRIKAKPGPRPKNHEPDIKVRKTEDGNIELRMDARTAAAVKTVVEHTRAQRLPLRFHFYAIVAVSMWATFETYLAMLLEELYRKKPELLKSQEVVTTADVIDSRNSVLDFLIERQLDRGSLYSKRTAELL